MDVVQVIMPKGAMGASADDDWLDAFLRAVAVKYDADPKGTWASKYGADYESDAFMMRRYCWCERDDCPWCGFDQGGLLKEKYGWEPGRGAPNFWYKPLGFKVWWYKYIGRSMETNRQLTRDEALEMMSRLLGDEKETA